jgi:hypothetical protein
MATEKIDKTLKNWVGEYGAPIPAFLASVVIVILYMVLRLSPETFKEIFLVIGILSPIWLPLFLLYFFWFFWMIYIKSDFIKNQENFLLEIKLPREIQKSPLAMEAVFSGLNHTLGESTEFARYWFGKLRTWFSFEIASIDGEVRFFVWGRDFFRKALEAQIYAQYPEVEIVDADDYTRAIRLDLKKIDVWGVDFKLNKPDTYPIKTYVDYNLDKDPKEEFKVDPMSHMIELMGSLGKGEQFWFQFIIRATKKERKKKGTWFKKTGWKEEAHAEIDKLMLRDPETKSTKKLTTAGFQMLTTLSEGEKDIIKAIERSITKPAFDVGIRGIYLAEKENFNPGNIAGLIGIMKQYNSNTLNEFTPTRYVYGFQYPWEDYKGLRQDRQRRRVFDAYRRRSYFHYPYKTQPFVLNTEELATMFHFPGATVQTPTVARVPSKKSEAPSDLPI